MDSSVGGSGDSSSDDESRAQPSTVVCSSSSSSSSSLSSDASSTHEFDEDEDDDDDEGEHVPKRPSPTTTPPRPAQPTSIEPPANANARDEYDQRFENMCRRLPATMQMRPTFMPYTPEIGYLNLQDQMTDVRGYLEPAATLYAEQRRAAQDQFRELFEDVDRILREEGISVDETPIAAQHQQPQQQQQPHDQPAPPPLPVPQPLPGNGLNGMMAQNEMFDPTNMANMLGDVMQQQVTFTTTQLPQHVDEERETSQRYAADGIRDVLAAQKHCIICSYMVNIESMKARALNEHMREFQKIRYWVVERPMDIVCAVASKYWNTEFVKPCKEYGVPAPPTITPSHVEICLLNCNHNLKGLLTLRREIKLFQDTLNVVVKNQLFVRQEVAGVPTNKLQVTVSGYKIMHDVINQLTNCRKLEWGAMTVIGRDNYDSPISANPLHDSAMRPVKRSELTREREQLNAAAKRNNKNFRGSSGMGGNTGVGVLQVGGYGGGAMGTYSGGRGNTAREHQNSQRHQLFHGGL